MKQVIPETPPEYDRTRIIERPDGFYWQSVDGNREHGPFPTLLEAMQDMTVEDEETPGAPDSVEEVEAQIGISDWIDPDTGEPAEESRTRTEEH